MSKYCVIGKSLPHTLSPQIHRALGCADYGVRELRDENALKKFVDGREYDGYNVTIPYKQSVIPLMDGLSPSAEAIGAVNTVVAENGKLIGYNTDIDGMRFALKNAGIDIKGKNVLILGSGGTSHTARYLCRADGAASAKVVSRTGVINYDNCYDLKGTEIIINTTPVGMMPHPLESPIDLSGYGRLSGVFDCVYNPLETKLIRQARSLNVPAANGLAMLVEQARIAHNLFARAVGSKVAPIEDTHRIVAEMKLAQTNVILIGMAGSGKSAIGRTVAKKMNREFADTDGVIEKETGKNIPSIFEKYGEERFRQLEREAVEKVCMRQGMVIATGGGAILDEDNVALMRSNGINFMILRDADKLSTCGRPLSSDKETAKKLFESRKEAYFKSADAIIENDDGIEDAADKIIDAFKTMITKRAL